MPERLVARPDSMPSDMRGRRDARHCHHRRGYQRLRHRTRRRGAGTVGAARRKRRPGERHVLGVDQADPRRTALSRALQFRLVRESLREREVLLAMAPHIIRPMRFVLPHHHGLRPAFLIRLGLFLYDHLGGREACRPPRRRPYARRRPAQPLKPGFPRGFEYSDCWVDDARLVVLNAMDAAAPRRRDSRAYRGRLGTAATATIGWSIAQHASAARSETVAARALVNASGAWMAE